MADQDAVHHPTNRPRDQVRLVDRLRKGLAAQMIRNAQKKVGRVDPNSVEIKKTLHDVDNREKREGQLEPENWTTVVQELRHRLDYSLTPSE